MTPSSQPLPSSGGFKPDHIVDVLWDCLVESAVHTFLFLFMGSIALEIVGGVFEDMMPSPPPGLASSEAKAPSSSHYWRSSFSKHKVPIVFTIIFVLLASHRLFGRRQQNAQPDKPSRLQRIGQELSENWFSLIVGNAFGAMVAAMVLMWVQKFSLAQIVWGWIFHSIASPLQGLAEKIFGASSFDVIGRWFSWYGENQLKFDFWLVYFASVCDDLGLPNLKTLARFAWRRFRKRNRATPSEPVAQEPA